MTKDLETRYRSYKNVYREPLIWGLPISYLLPFGGTSIINMMMMYVSGPVLGFWIVTIIQLLLNAALFFVFRTLVEKHGVYFMNRLLANYLYNTFTIVRNNRKVGNILMERKAKGGIK